MVLITDILQKNNVEPSILIEHLKITLAQANDMLEINKVYLSSAEIIKEEIKLRQLENLLLKLIIEECS